MRFPINLIVVFAVLGGAAAASYRPITEYWENRNRPNWRAAKIEQGRIVAEVVATGTIKPVRSVQIGAVVSGPITYVSPRADFNKEVEKDEILAKIDPRPFEANQRRDEAILQTRQAEEERVHSLLQQAMNDEKRALALQQEDEDFISQAELDQVRFNRLSLEAQLKVAKAAVKQAKASLENTTASLEYTEIKAPEDGVIIDRKIDPGQSLAAQFQTPELFVIAPEIRRKVHIHASVDEADIGYIYTAKENDLSVRFTVDAYREELFEGKIEQIRLNSTTTQNVVTYPVIITAPNSTHPSGDLKLLPGMTASISFQIEERNDVIKIPNAALRYYPDIKHVHPDDRKIIDGSSESDGDRLTSKLDQSATVKAKEARNRNKRHVWVAVDAVLRAIPVTTGISDNKFTELVSGDLKVGQELVVGIRPKS